MELMASHPPSRSPASAKRHARSTPEDPALPSDFPLELAERLYRRSPVYRRSDLVRALEAGHRAFDELVAWALEADYDLGEVSHSLGSRIDQARVSRWLAYDARTQ